MKYSKAKKIITALHAAGWKKYYDQSYVKTWSLEEAKFSRRIDFFEIAQLNYPLPNLVELLDEFDEQAHYELNKFYKDRLKDS